MPLYDYDCAECGRRVEVIHGVHAPGPTHCPNCGGGPLRKAITAAAVHFKGSGWAKKERHAAVASSASKTDDTSSRNGDGEDAGATDKTKDKGKDEPAAADASKGSSTTPAEGSTDKSADRRDRDVPTATPSKPAAAGTTAKTA